MRALLLAVAIGLLACSTGEAAARKPATVKITIESMKFSPAEVTAKPGDTIVWTNNDIVAHTVTSTANRFDSKIIPPGGTFKYVAKGKGAFPYKCALHPMTAALTVR
jgi:plastocyanin